MNQSGETLEAIVISVKRVADIVGEIAAASREQSAGIEQINRAVAQMDQVTQANASQTEEMSGTAVAMSTQAEQLQRVVGQFNLKKNDLPQPNVASPKGTRSERTVSRSRSGGWAASNRSDSDATSNEGELVGASAGGHSGFEEF